MAHVMIDLETLGTRPGCALLSIGAAVFRPTGEGVGDTFYMNIDRNSCFGLEMHVDEGTVKWWSQQSQEAQDALMVDPRHINDVVAEFDIWFKKNEGQQVWAQGSNFDPVLWDEACKKVGVSAPWKFFNARDTRTVYEAFGLDSRTIKRQGTYHNALDDVLHQVRCVQTAFKRKVW